MIDRIPLENQGSQRKQRHTAMNTFEHLRDEYGLTGGYTIVKDYSGAVLSENVAAVSWKKCRRKAQHRQFVHRIDCSIPDAASVV